MVTQFWIVLVFLMLWLSIFGAEIDMKTLKLLQRLVEAEKSPTWWVFSHDNVRLPFAFYPAAEFISFPNPSSDRSAVNAEKNMQNVFFKLTKWFTRFD